MAYRTVIDPRKGRVAPDRRWFGNTRIIKQEELDKFREEMSTRWEKGWKERGQEGTQGGEGESERVFFICSVHSSFFVWSMSARLEKAESTTNSTYPKYWWFCACAFFVWCLVSSPCLVSALYFVYRGYCVQQAWYTLYYESELCTGSVHTDGIPDVLKMIK